MKLGKAKYFMKQSHEFFNSFPIHTASKYLVVKKKKVKGKGTIGNTKKK